MCFQGVQHFDDDPPYVQNQLRDASNDYLTALLRVTVDMVNTRLLAIDNSLHVVIQTHRIDIRPSWTDSAGQVPTERDDRVCHMVSFATLHLN